MRYAAGLCLATCMLLMPADRAVAQAVPAGVSPTGDTNPTDQPLAGQSLGSSLTLNQGVSAINAENESFDRFGLGLTASGGGQTNFLGSQTNKQNAGYAQFTADGGVLLRSSRTRYFALYQPQYNLYPQFSDVNNFSQTAFQSVTHAMSEHTALAWNTTGARYLSLNQFLPQSLGIGGIGVVVPTVGTQLLKNSFEVTNAATTLVLQHLMSARMTFTGTLTSGLFLLVPNATGSAAGSVQKFVTSGADMQLDYQRTLKDTIGIRVTPIYVYGLRPSGHEVVETLQGTYQRQLTPTLTASVSAGPLFVQASLPPFGGSRKTSYAVGGSLSRQIRQSQFSVTYSRALLVNLLTPSYLSNAFGANVYLPRGSHWIFSGAASYTLNDAGSLANTTSTVGAGHILGGSAQMAYQLTSKMQIFALYSLISQEFSVGTTSQSIGFTRNQFGGGIRFNLGNPITRGGMQ